MSKSRNHNRKRFEDEYEYYFEEVDRKQEKKLQDRRMQKKIKNALRSRDLGTLTQYDELE